MSYAHCPRCQHAFHLAQGCARCAPTVALRIEDPVAAIAVHLRAARALADRLTSGQREALERTLANDGFGQAPPVVTTDVPVPRLHGATHAGARVLRRVRRITAQAQARVMTSVERFAPPALRLAHDLRQRFARA